MFLNSETNRNYQDGKTRLCRLDVQIRQASECFSGALSIVPHFYHLYLDYHHIYRFVRNTILYDRCLSVILDPIKRQHLNLKPYHKAAVGHHRLGSRTKAFVFHWKYPLRIWRKNTHIGKVLIVIHVTMLWECPNVQRIDYAETISVWTSRAGLSPRPRSRLVRNHSRATHPNRKCRESYCYKWLLVNAFRGYSFYDSLSMKEETTTNQYYLSLFLRVYYITYSMKYIRCMHNSICYQNICFVWRLHLRNEYNFCF